MASLLRKFGETIQNVGADLVNRVDEERHSHTHSNPECSAGTLHSSHRYGSFAHPRDGNDVKWHVDGCSYMWAVSRALEQARESIWILDCEISLCYRSGNVADKLGWLSPELYLRRPPSRNEQYRIDRMLLAAAQRGAKVNIIVYKEVTQALTRKYLSPTLPNYLHSLLPGHTDPVTRTLSGLGLAAIFKSLEYQEAENPLIAPPVPVSSSHTKHALEDLHPNICVFRHPDHLPDRTTFETSFVSSLRNLSLNAATVSKMPGDALKAIYGMNEDVILYWAHHEKLCIVDSKIAFMGGLDLCYGRWDTNQHPIADAHPGNLDEIVFPGQDFNNARIMDFSDVVHWENNKLDRKESSRMGWSDISISLRGPVVKDLREHFVDRWNFIYNEKYDVRQDTRYSRLSLIQNPFSSQFRGNEDSQRGDSSGFGSHEYHHGHHHRIHDLKERFEDRLEQGMQEVQDQYLGGGEEGGISCQVVRSCSNWSHNVPTEHSIANAYISIIENSQHFVYIENQFFITATSNAQHPVRNRIGGAIVERILRAARAGQKYKVIVLMPAIPAFAGDLKDEASLGTRAIMEFQYNSINRGGHSIMESIAKAGFDPTDYIRFYNLRNYDRINASASMREAEQKSGVDYETARRQHDVNVDLTGYLAQGAPGDYNSSSQAYQRYQQAASTIPDRKGLGNNRWDTVSECYMLGGQDIRTVPWEEGDLTEMDAFVSEELYIHSKAGNLTLTIRNVLTRASRC